MTAVAVLAAMAAPVAAEMPSDDHARAVNVVPPGQSGFIDLSTFAQAQASSSPSYGPHFSDQLDLYTGWKYKPFQFESELPGATHPGGNSHVLIARDSYGVPVVTADNEPDLAFGLGYAMTQDRLFQMELFRRVGHGTIAELIGASGIPSDQFVRTLSEGKDARTAELNAAPADVRQRTQRFADGVNQSIKDQCPVVGAATCPAEFLLLGDYSILTNPWTPDDTLAFGEYAGRFFGEFGHTEIQAAGVYVDLVKKIGQAAADKAFADIYQLQDPSAPVIINPADGLFPRHSGPAVASGFAGSPLTNHDTSLYPSATALASTWSAISSRLATASATAERLGIIKHFGSNAFAIDGRHTADRNPILYSGPQTGWAVPGFFWEVELKSPARHIRGVALPAVPVVVIGRNEDSAWSVTSALDANSDIFVEQLSTDNSTYLHNGQQLPVTARTETINCNNPPTSALPLLKGQVPQLCPLTPTQLTVYSTLHGSALAPPDASHHLFTLQSTVSGHVVESFRAWDSAAQQHTASGFRQALSQLFLAFNFFYIDRAGEVAYIRSGRYPIRAGNVDVNLPLPGTGAYDWSSFETWQDTPHVVNPGLGYVANWNNKAAALWPSKAVISDALAPDRFGPHHQVETLDAMVRHSSGLTLDRAGLIPKQVAYEDSRARVFLPYLIPALQQSGDTQLITLAGKLQAWDLQRVDQGGRKLHTATTFFDRWLEHMLLDTFSGVLNSADLSGLEGLNCTKPLCVPPNIGSHFASVDNLDAVSMKVELAILHTLFNAINGRTAFDFFGGQLASAVMVKAAHDAVAELTQADGSDPAKWTEPVERGAFGAQGAGSAPDLVPLPNRGSYGQVVEVLTAAGSNPPGLPIGLPNGMPNTAAPAPTIFLLMLLALVGAVALARRRPSRSRRS